EHIVRRHWWMRVLAVVVFVIAALAVLALRQTLAERDAKALAQANEHRAITNEKRAERLRAVAEVELQATQARLDVREQPDVALAEAARAWRLASRITPEPSDPSSDESARRARVTAASALSGTLQARDGLKGHFHGAHGAVCKLSTHNETVTELDSEG